MATRSPNFLIIMADFMGALALPPYGNLVAKTPNITRLAEEGVVFQNAYCNYPLCAPSRASMMSGLLPSQIGVYDNGAEFPASIPTFAHYLRRLGYRCELSGKMHFVGPDQLHGFDQRLTSDLVPADFGWMPPWRESDREEWPSLEPIRNAGVAARTMGIDFDEEVTHRTVRRLYDFARDPDQQPFLLTVSFIEPHEPFKTTRKYWDRYSDAEVGLPSVPLLDEASWDAHSRRLYEFMGIDRGAERGGNRAGAPWVLFDAELCRPQDRRNSIGPSGDRAGGGHDGHRHGGSRLYAGRARLVGHPEFL